MPLNIQCKYCANLRNDWCEKIEDSPHPDISRDCRYYRTLTNADRIQAMNNEELAEFICHKYFVPHCPIPICKNDDDDCVECWLSWLKSPVEEEKT